MLRVTGSNTTEEHAGGTWWYKTDETEGEDSWRAGAGEFWWNVCKAVDADDVDADDVDADDVDADDVDADDVDADDVDEANTDVDDVGVDNVDDVEVDNDTVHVGCPVLLASIIEIKTDDQYKIWRAAFSAEPQAVPSGVSGEAWNVCSWEDTSLKELINGNGWSDEGPSFLVSVMAVIPTTAS